MNFCEHCGAKLSPGFKFCMQCGSPVGSVQAAPPPQPLAPGIPPEARIAAEIQSKQNRRVWIALLILLLLCALFLALTFFNGFMDETAIRNAMIFFVCFVGVYLFVFLLLFHLLKRSTMRDAGIDHRKFGELLRTYRWMVRQQKDGQAQAAHQGVPVAAAPAATAPKAASSSSSSFGFIFIMLLCCGMLYFAYTHLNELTGGGSSGGSSRTLSGEWVDSAGGSSSLDPGGNRMASPAVTIVFKSNGTCYFSQVGVDYDSSRPVKYKISGSKITFSGYGKNTTGTISGSTITAFGIKYVPLK